MDEFCVSILRARMAEGFLPGGKIHRDVQTVEPEDASSLDGLIGGFPCQVPCLMFVSSFILRVMCFGCPC